MASAGVGTVGARTAWRRDSERCLGGTRSEGYREWVPLVMVSAICYESGPIMRAVILLTLVGISCASAAEPLRALVAARIDAEVASLDAIYKDLHQHPELSFHEERSAAKVAEGLGAAGFEVTAKVGGHGVVGVLRNGSGPVVLVRADMDALPVKEETGLPYASRIQTKNDKGDEVSVMHACGHDMHMTCLIGTARVMEALKDRWRGTLIFIGQPSEERISGAKAMLEDGLFTRFPKPNYCIALHVSADIPTGSIGYTEGRALASSDSVDVVIRGVSGHGAAPHATRDTIVLASQFVLALQTIVSRETNPIEPSVVTVGSIHGGTKHNIIPDEVRLQLTLRSYSEEVRERQIASIRRIARGLAEAAGIPADRMPVVTATEESVGATYNDPALTRRVVGALEGWFGREKIMVRTAAMASEDFSYYGRKEDGVPCCIFWLGAVDPKAWHASKSGGAALPSLHNSKFAPVPETTLRTGVAAMSAAVLELVGKP